jgi:hypothetical protein
MHIEIDQALVEVGPGKFLHIEKAAGMSLFCISGSLWITRKDCIRDFELVPGDTYVADSPQSLTVCGFEPSIVRVFQPGRTTAPTTLHVALKNLRLAWTNAIKNPGWRTQQPD